jgi:predicted flap endonuclease-1-like 5' DNA nuclease
VIEKINPVENIIERKVDVKVDKIVERVRPIENLVERTVDVKVDKIVEKLRPVENIVERMVDVKIDRIIEKVRPVENEVERFVDAPAAAAPGPAPAAAKRKVDDLKLIEGVGPKIEELFHNKGIYTFEEVARLTPDWIRKMLKDGGPNFVQWNPDTWPEQSRLAADGKWEQFETLKKELNSGKRK